jgi:hypothetical protein
MTFLNTDEYDILYLQKNILEIQAKTLLDWKKH